MIGSCAAIGAGESDGRRSSLCWSMPTVQHPGNGGRLNAATRRVTARWRGNVGRRRYISPNGDTRRDEDQSAQHHNEDSCHVLEMPRQWPFKGPRYLYAGEGGGQTGKDGARSEEWQKGR